ncbi:MAG: YraN family protein [Deltaproteobacteria bacterium]|nr:YraN family protein [Deltaproteobacteria bacterium]MBI3079586.1 YraN family protein [Deltaproteobacteria bacterium]
MGPEQGERGAAPGGTGRPARADIAARGEEAAAAYFEANGTPVLARNYRSRYGEIDLIVADRGTLVFVEVKARTSTAVALPQEAVTGRKQRRICRTALAYLQRHGRAGQAARFDVVAVTWRGGTVRIEHLPDAFPLRVDG